MKWFLPAIIFSLLSCMEKGREMIKPQVQNITESVYAFGIVKSLNQHEIYSTVNGVISHELVKEGDLVQKGDILMILANETPKLNTENAELAATYASVSSNYDKLNESKIGIALALEKMKNDSVLFIRQQSLWKEGIGTRNDLEQRALAWKNSLTAYETLQLQYNNLKKQIDFSAKQSLKNLQISHSMYNDYSIKSTQDGRVYNILKKTGELASIQSPIAIIGDQNEFMMELQVDEYDIGKIRPGQKVFVSMDSYQGQVFYAAITRIQPIMDDRSRSFKVEAAFTTRPPNLYPNLTVEANILISTKENALTIPRSYLIDETFVLLKSGEKRKVLTGLKDYQRVEIISGLSKDNVLKKPAE